MLKAKSTIPIVFPTLHNFDEVVHEFRQAWESGQVTTGTFTRQFEMVVEEKLEVPHTIMVQSCTAGLMLVMRAMELKGEVILPSFSWTATALAVIWNGLIPVFAEITPGVCTLDPEAVANAITPRTAAVMPVNVFGCPPNYEAFAQLAQDNHLALLYDSAQGLGSRYQGDHNTWHYAGGFGDAEVFSLSPTKVVSAMEGGLITTRNDRLAQKLRRMRDYGKTADGEDIAWLGLSARIPEINAIVARYNFTHLDELVRRRQELIQAYKKTLGELAGVSYQTIPANFQSSWNYFTLFINAQEARYSRDEVYDYLKKQGIQAKKYFYPALHQQKVYQEIGGSYLGKLPITETAAAQGLALPLYSHMEIDTVAKVAESLRVILR
ncbi:MAG: DegT/DnrJ/EryC1/StrS family aminotransferase [Deltaproteobacteria bacterium]|nr:DegT/DnrJ/EryC1/StrS family aminotransferase [Deltaproteobacteria bacterium]